MDLKDIEKIMQLMDAHGLQQFKLEQDDTKLELRKPEEIDMETIQKFMPPPMMQAPTYSPHPMQSAPHPGEGGAVQNDRSTGLRAGRWRRSAANSPSDRPPCQNRAWNRAIR